MAELSDQALIARVTVFGNRRAFDTLVCRYQSPLRRFLQNLTGDLHQGLDAARYL